MTVQAARRFCANVNQLSQQLATKDQLVQQPLSAASADGIPEQLRKLSELKDQGILTDGEFTAKKVELLARL